MSADRIGFVFLCSVLVAHIAIMGFGLYRIGGYAWRLCGA